MVDGDAKRKYREWIARDGGRSKTLVVLYVAFLLFLSFGGFLC